MFILPSGQGQSNPTSRRVVRQFHAETLSRFTSGDVQHRILLRHTQSRGNRPLTLCLRQEHFRQHPNGIRSFPLQHNIMFMHGCVEIIPPTHPMLMTTNCTILTQTLRFGTKTRLDHTQSCFRFTAPPSITPRGRFRRLDKHSLRFRSTASVPTGTASPNIAQHLPDGRLCAVSPLGTLAHASRRITLQILPLQRAKTCVTCHSSTRHFAPHHRNFRGIQVHCLVRRVVIHVLQESAEARVHRHRRVLTTTHEGNPSGGLHNSSPARLRRRPLGSVRKHQWLTTRQNVT